MPNDEEANKAIAALNETDLDGRTNRREAGESKITPEVNNKP